MSKPRIVTKYEQVLQNIRTFQKEIKVELDDKDNKLVGTLSHFRAWYALKDGDKWIFGPSKFVGYKELTAEKYAANHNQGMDGRQTEVALNAWFTEVTASPFLDELKDDLSEFLAEFGKKPSTLARVSILRNGLLDEDADRTSANSVAEALITLYRSLPEESRQEFRRRLKKEA